MCVFSQCTVVMWAVKNFVVWIAENVFRRYPSNKETSHYWTGWYCVTNTTRLSSAASSWPFYMSHQIIHPTVDTDGESGYNWSDIKKCEVQSYRYFYNLNSSSVNVILASIYFCPSLTSMYSIRQWTYSINQNLWHKSVDRLWCKTFKNLFWK